MSKKFLENIKKRNGNIAEFKQEKITRAVEKAMKELGKNDTNGKNVSEISRQVSDTVTHRLKKSYGYMTPNVEEVQDVVEEVLLDGGHSEIARTYILYRHIKNENRQRKAFLKKIEGLIDSYISKDDWRVKENSNVSYSISAMQEYISGAVIAEYTLKHGYPPEIARAHREGDFHIHDLSVGTFAGYCAGWSLSQLLLEGFNGVRGRIAARPAKHFNAVLGQIVNFMGTLQNEWAGAQAFSSFDTYLAPLVAKDNLSYAQVKQSVQEFIFAINATSRWGNQVPFTNLTFDLVPPEDLRDKPIIYGGEILNDEKYGDFQKEMDMINRAFIEIMLKGDMDGRVFTFPIPTYNITKEFDWDSEISDLLFEMTSRYGIPYFQNFINSDLRPTDVRSMCCRLQLDVRELKKKTGALFGSGEKTGSIGVVTINLPRLGYTSDDEETFFEKLEELMYLAKESLEIKRKDVSKNMAQGLLPWSKRYLGNLDNHFSTIGLVGMNETCLNYLGKDISTPEGKQFALKVMDFMREKLEVYQDETSHIYNLEATPAEGTAYRLARLDRKKFGDSIIAAGGETPYYTNSSHLPVHFTDDVLFALDHQQELQSKYTGGTVLHTFLGESLVSSQACKEFVRKIAYKSTLPYFTITPTYSICDEHGYISGEHHSCPTCENKTEVYSRVVGYYRPVGNWNDGKQQEFTERKTYSADFVSPEEIEEVVRPVKEKTKKKPKDNPETAVDEPEAPVADVKVETQKQDNSQLALF